jgi:hypothetical protein
MLLLLRVIYQPPHFSRLFLSLVSFTLSSQSYIKILSVEHMNKNNPQSTSAATVLVASWIEVNLAKISDETFV